jgi:hypothetical protein
MVSLGSAVAARRIPAVSWLTCATCLAAEPAEVEIDSYPAARTAKASGCERYDSEG